MSNAKPPLHPGMTALAAVIAISSTPLLAQSVDGSTTAPPVEAAPAISVPAPVLAPEAATPAPAEATAPAAMAPAIESPTPAVAAPVDATPAAVTPAEPEAAPVVKSVRRVERKATAVTEAPAATPAPAAAVPPIVEEALPEVAPMAGAPVPEAVEPLVTQTTSESATSSDMDASDILPFAGAGALIVGGAAYALSRRKRRKSEDEDFVFENAVSDTVMTPVPAPAYSLTDTSPVWTKEPIVAPKRSKVVTGRRETRLPEGFDISIYGPHVQEAYRGPTEDNPSLSLKRRLKRARFFDQRDRRLGQTIRKTDAAPAFSPQVTRTLEPAY